MKSKPGCTLRVSARWGPGVRWKSRALSRISRYAFQFRTGRARSNAPRGIILTAPARAAPGLSGVGENTTSTRARLLIESISSETDRAVPPPGFAEATLKPSIVTGT